LLRFAQHIAGRSPDKAGSPRWQAFAEENLAPWAYCPGWNKGTVDIDILADPSCTCWLWLM
jgi:hypothetical protein